MTKIDLDYYQRRAAEERRRAESGGPTASVHAELAARYAALLANKAMTAS